MPIERRYSRPLPNMPLPYDYRFYAAHLRMRLSRVLNRVGWLAAAVPLFTVLFLPPLLCNAQSDDANRAPPAPATPTTVTLQPITVIGTTPLIGSGIDRDLVPAETHVLTGRTSRVSVRRTQSNRSTSSWVELRSIPPRVIRSSRPFSITVSRHRRCKAFPRVSRFTSTGCVSTSRSATRSTGISFRISPSTASTSSVRTLSTVSMRLAARSTCS